MRSITAARRRARYEAGVAQPKTLTERQVSVLRWIAEGCPNGVVDDEFHRTSAAALRRRGLVGTSGRGPTWMAKVTHAGREYLAQVEGPSPPTPRKANGSVTQRLVDDVGAAGGSLRVPRRGAFDGDGVDYEHRARLAERLGKVPEGRRLIVTRREGELELRLVDAPGQAGGRAELVPIAIPEKVGRYDPTARQFRDRAERHEVSRGSLRRATRIVHAIAVEAERRGWSARPSPESRNGYGRDVWTGTKDGHLQIEADDHDFRLLAREEGAHTRGRWEEEVKRYRDRELPSGRFDAGATGRLKLELASERWWIHRGRQSRWADRQSWSLEERLPYLFREIEGRIAEAARVAEEEQMAREKAAEAARRNAEERERQWALLMEQAEERLVEERRATELRAQADAWHEADRLRRYCDAMAAAFGDDPETAKWLAWARAHAARRDPLTESPTMPNEPEATPEALQPYLPEGWRAEGPYEGLRAHGPTR